MSSHSPQRSRKPQTHSSTQASMQNPPPREMSPSPSFRDRQRMIKSQSMPLGPSVMQIFANQNPQTTSQQPSPTTSNHSNQSGRSPPAAIAPPSQHPPPGSRVLPSPPRPNPNNPPPNNRDTSPDRVPPVLQHAHTQPDINARAQPPLGYPRPIPRSQPPQFLTKFDGAQESWQMTDELMAEIERADLQAQGQSQSHVAYVGPHVESGSPPKEPPVERVKAGDRTSPKENDGGQRRLREQQTARESPKNRERQTHTPEHRDSPLGTPGEHPANYIQYKRDSPPVLRRVANAPNAPHTSQTPPLQTVQTRTPDRSLPLQEELEDEVVSRDREKWDNDSGPSVAPYPSVRYRDDDHGGRESRAGHRDESDETLIDQGRGHERDDEEGFTPRSPTANLPDDVPQRFYMPPNPNLKQPLRTKHRNGSTDQLGLQGFDPALFDHTGGNSVPDHRRQDSEERRRSTQRPQEAYDHSQDRRIFEQGADQGRLYPPRIHPDDLHYTDYPTAAFLQAYLLSPRPNAPVPPTPQSQTAAPTPSPLVSGGYDGRSRDLPPFTPVPPIGSPYPFPFTHVRRTHGYNNNNPNHLHAPSNHESQPSAIKDVEEEFAKQWQMYLMNNHGHVSDSTFSPSSTPFQAPGYNPWAFFHTNRALGAHIHDPRSMQSSPSHEPVPLPVPPTVGIKKKERSANLRKQPSARKPPPRVDSTQPRETSPEPSSSGEETAGEIYAVAEEGNWVNNVAEEDNGDWIDEDEDDEDDLLELEYHPSFVTNVEKRRRRWETRWEALIQAFQALDRQTDATLVLLASPSHSNKLHAVMSRSVRREPELLNSPGMANIRTGFRHIASRRRVHRTRKVTLADRLLAASSSSLDSPTDASSESREEDLKRALEAALGTLGAVGTIYEQREARWREEMRRVSNDREKVEFLLRQALGADTSNGSVARGL